MSELAPQPRPDERDPARWRWLFQHSTEPLFLLNQHRRILGVNAACAALLGSAASEFRGLVCSSRPGVGGPPEWAAFAAALRPPAEVLEGRQGRARRPVLRPGKPRQWWDIEYFPLRDAKGRLRLLGKITVADVEDSPDTLPLPATLAELREQFDQQYSLDWLESAAPVLRRVANQVRLAAHTRVPVLLTGEPGAGKEWLARTIHAHGLSRERHFAAVDATALPPPVVDGALFGAGGVLGNRSVGTVYLRNIEKLPRELQDRVNDWLSSGVAGPRLLASVESTGAGLIESLHCTLGTLVIAVPPLRERLADVAQLSQRFLSRPEAGAGRAALRLSAAAESLFQAYAWPGNLGELREVLEGARSCAHGDRIEIADLPLSLRLAVGTEGRAPPTDRRPLQLDAILEQVERRLIGLALEKSRGNKSRAAESLSIWRARLLRRVEALGLGTDKEP